MTPQTDSSCDQSLCYAVVVGVITQFDQHHLTASFVKTMAPYLRPAIVAALDRPAS
jgi:uncharacterized ion transporter superfamily protein YfcC